MVRYLIIAVVVLGLLAGCAPDPRNEAEAYQIRTQAEIEAAAARQAEAQNQADWELKHQQAEETSAAWVAAVKTFIKTVLYILIGAVWVIIAALAAGLAWASVGTGQAIAVAAMNKANTIRLDVQTRQYPLYLAHLGEGRLSLTDMNTGQTRLLDVRNAADRQLIGTSGAIRLSGAVAYEARRAKQSDSTGVALVGTNPAIVAPQEYQPKALLPYPGYQGQQTNGN